jgi:hypothetical protein
MREDDPEFYVRIFRKVYILVYLTTLQFIQNIIQGDAKIPLNTALNLKAVSSNFVALCI